MKVDRKGCCSEVREKRILRKLSNRFGLCFFVVIAIQLMYLYCLGLNNLQNKEIELISSFFSWIIPYFFMIKISNQDFARTISLNGPIGYGIQYFFIGLTFSYAASFISSFILKFLELINISSVAPNSLMEYENTPLGILYFFIAVAIFPAIVEEFVFRGVLLGCLREYGDHFAIVASAMAFGLFHGNIEQFVFTFLLGLFLAFVVIKTNSIIIAVLIHFASNLRACIIKVLSDNMVLWMKPVTIYAIVIISVIPGLIFYFQLRKHNKQAVTSVGLNEGRTVLTLGEKVKCFIFNPGMILCLIYVTFTIINSIKAGSQI